MATQLQRIENARKEQELKIKGLIAQGKLDEASVALELIKSFWAEVYSLNMWHILNGDLAIAFMRLADGFDIQDDIAARNREIMDCWHDDR